MTASVPAINQTPAQIATAAAAPATVTPTVANVTAPPLGTPGVIYSYYTSDAAASPPNVGHLVVTFPGLPPQDLLVTSFVPSGELAGVATFLGRAHRAALQAMGAP